MTSLIHALRPGPWVLSQNRWLRFVTFALLYAAQGVPYGFLSIAMAAWLAQNGLSATKTGMYMGVILLPWSLKLIAGPVMDRWSYLPMGRRRPWILAGQAGLMLSLFALVFIPDPSTNLLPLIVVSISANSFAALQDVASDGMAVEVLPAKEQAKANGIMWGAKMLGVAGAAAGCAWFLTHYGLAAAAIAGACVVGLVFAALLSVREREGERLLPWSQGEATADSIALQATSLIAIGRDVWKASVMPASLLIGAAAFWLNAASGLFGAATPVLSTQQLGWTSSEFSNTVGVGSMLGGVLGMVIGGPLLDRFGRLRVMRLLVLAYILLHATGTILTDQLANRTLLSIYVCVDQVLVALMAIATFAIAMGLCWKRVAATQFTLYMTVSNLGTSLGSIILGATQTAGGYWLVMLVVCLMTCVVLMLLHFANLARHTESIQKLDNPVQITSGARMQPAPLGP